MIILIILALMVCLYGPIMEIKEKWLAHKGIKIETKQKENLYSKMYDIPCLKSTTYGTCYKSMNETSNRIAFQKQKEAEQRAQQEWEQLSVTEKQAILRERQLRELEAQRKADMIIGAICKILT